MKITIDGKTPFRFLYANTLSFPKSTPLVQPKLPLPALPRLWFQT